ncbi:MAG TPA: beta/gamma crystallin-related protein [Waterburya sp.]|jgi:hypothetical protein
MKEFQNEQLFQELENEVAATCSGGVAYLYQNDSFGGRRLQFFNRESDLRNWDFNDKTSSIKIEGNERWTFSRDILFQGPSVTLGPGSYYLRDLQARGIPNDSISSLRRIA